MQGYIVKDMRFAFPPERFVASASPCFEIATFLLGVSSGFPMIVLSAVEHRFDQYSIDSVKMRKKYECNAVDENV